MGIPVKQWFWACAAVLLAAACGCDGSESTSTTGGGGSGGSGGQGGTGGGLTFGASPVGLCFAEECASEIGVCKADPECTDYISCLEGCPVTDIGDAEPACVAGCPTGSGSQSMMAAAAVDTCRTKGPGAACLTCAKPLPDFTTPVLLQMCPDPSMETNVCFKCEDEKCCDTYAACKGNPECEAIVKDCIALCPDDDANCQKDCVAQHPDGADALGARLACMRVRCFADQPMCDRCQRAPEQVCFYDTCGDVYAAFLAGKDGFALESCIIACPIDDTACDEECYNAYPEAAMRYGDLAECAQASCTL